jgi:hypothetical protein
MIGNAKIDANDPLSDLDGDILFAGMAVTAMAYWGAS